MIKGSYKQEYALNRNLPKSVESLHESVVWTTEVVSECSSNRGLHSTKSWYWIICLWDQLGLLARAASFFFSSSLFSMNVKRVFGSVSCKILSKLLNSYLSGLLPGLYWPLSIGCRLAGCGTAFFSLLLGPSLDATLCPSEASSCPK